MCLGQEADSMKFYEKNPGNLRIRTIDAIPKNAAGKIQYGKLKTNK